MKKNSGEEVNPHSITFIISFLNASHREIQISGKFSVGTPNYKVADIMQNP